MSDANRTIEEGQPSGQDGGHNTIRALARWPKPDDILTIAFSGKTRKIFTSEEWQKIGPSVTIWHYIFVLACLCALLIDPLIFYIFVRDDDKKCVKADGKLRGVYLILRSVTDVFYWIDFFFKVILIRLAYGKAMKLYKYGFARTLLLSVISIFISLPFPQVILLMFTSSNRMDAILLLAPFQYEIRVFFFYGRLLQLRRNKTGLLLHFILLLILLSFPAHLVGSGWYYLALSRVRDCWRDACKKTNGCHFETNYRTICADDRRFKSINSTVLIGINNFCPINPANATIFDFGIYLYALQSNMTTSGNVPHKVGQCFWWGLRNLSSLGSNLQTSVDGVEIFLAITVCITGVVLFLMCISRMTEVLTSIVEEDRLRRTARTMNPDVDLWLTKMDLPEGFVPARTDLKKTITKNIRKKLEENKHVDSNDFLSILPIEHRRDIMSHLRVTSLKKVPELGKLIYSDNQEWNKRVLKAISDHLMPVVYPEDSYIMREKEPLEKMLFITQGRAWLYASSGNASGASSSSSSCSSTIKCLGNGDFYGEELIEWSLTRLGSNSEFRIPISSGTVKAHTTVEGFILRADDLERVVCNFWWYYSNGNRYLGQLDDREYERWHNLAVSAVRKLRQLRVNRPETLRAEENHACTHLHVMGKRLLATCKCFKPPNRSPPQEVELVRYTPSNIVSPHMGSNPPNTD